MTVSVIIPSFNSESTIEDNLRALQDQTYESEYEIILVDSSTDATPSIVREKFPAVRLFHLDKKTDPGTARNIGIRNSKGEIVLLIDSDCIAAPDWIDRYVRLHEMNDHAAIGGAVSNGNDPRSLIAWAGYFAEFRDFLPERPAAEVAHIPTCNISYKSWIFTLIGGFNPNYYPQEDLEFNYRLSQAGHKILFDPTVEVLHHHRTTLGAFFSHQLTTGKITSRLLKTLPLEGSGLVKNLAAVTVMLPILPAVKWLRTIAVFVKYKRWVLLRRFFALWVFALGLIPWTIGFYSGVIAENSHDI